ncbi:MAG: DUF4013 domain-containing protein [Anaerolineae bacterium]
MNIDYAKGLTFAFDDKDWLSKLGKGALWAFISMILVIPAWFFSTGYGLQTAKNVMRGEKHPLPNLDDIGSIFVDGLKFFLASFVLLLPMIVLICIMMSGMIAAGTAADSLDEDTLGAIMGGSAIVVQCIAGLYGILIGFIMPALMVRYLQTDGDIRETLNMGKLFAIVREHFVPCLMILLMSFAASIAFQFAFYLSFITICGWIFVFFAGIPWLAAVQGHLVGQFASNLDNKMDGVESY